MGFKKKTKVTAEFNMSSLTDIIFLLLIFFMLTSSIVSPNSLNLKLPSSSRVKQPPSNKLTEVEITETGKYYFDGDEISKSNLEGEMRSFAKSKGKDANLVLSWDKDTGVEHVVVVMDLALKYHINTILAAEK